MTDPERAMSWSEWFGVVGLVLGLAFIFATVYLYFDPFRMPISRWWAFWEVWK